MARGAVTGDIHNGEAAIAIDWMRDVLQISLKCYVLMERLKFTQQFLTGYIHSHISHNLTLSGSSLHKNFQID